jgi:hypothetical protein
MSQCFKKQPCDEYPRVEDGGTIDFDSSPLADLSDITQRMPFVLRAAARFDEMLQDANRSALEQSIREIAAGGRPS